MVDSTATHAVRRSNSSFSLRFLFGLMLFCAGLMAFWGAFIQPYPNEASLIAQLREHGIAVKTEPDSDSWTRAFLGDDHCRRLVEAEFGDQATAADLELLRRAPKLRRLRILKTAKITAEDLSRVPTMKNLKELDVSGSAASDAGLRHIGALTKLESLKLEGSFRDAGVNHLRGLGQLQRLTLGSAHLTDDALPALGALRNLRELHLIGLITDAGMPHLQHLMDLQSLVCEGDSRKAQMLEGLDDDTYYEFQSTPVWYLPDYFSDVHGIPIRLDSNELRRAEKDLEAPVTAKHLPSFSPISLRRDQLLGPLDLDYLIFAEEVIITTKQAAEKRRPGITALRKSLPSLKNVTVQW